MAVSGNIVNLGSFLEQALSPANPQPRVKQNDWEGCAHDNPILERPGVGPCISRIFLVCRNTPARKISTPANHANTRILEVYSGSDRRTKKPRFLSSGSTTKLLATRYDYSTTRGIVPRAQRVLWLLCKYLS